ncbi:DUF6527 family protein [Paraburkholderia sp. SIMBA_054]|uniref:DUF6527 family protein n=1 Tax=Paraburkholderia sp. SIMBA_054 TaxID=3085795 RepID=UPI00397A883E
MKIEELKRDDGVRTMMFDCPGCGTSHQVNVAGSGVLVWGWNGSMDRPTFAPSVLVTGVKQLTDEQHETYLKTGALPEAEPLRCHSFVTDGRIQFLGDCLHALAGQTVELPDVE